MCQGHHHTGDTLVSLPLPRVQPRSRASRSLQAAILADGNHLIIQTRMLSFAPAQQEVTHRSLAPSRPHVRQATGLGWPGDPQRSPLVPLRHRSATVGPGHCFYLTAGHVSNTALHRNTLNRTNQCPHQPSKASKPMQCLHAQPSHRNAFKKDRSLPLRGYQVLKPPDDNPRSLQLKLHCWEANVGEKRGVT